MVLLLLLLLLLLVRRHEQRTHTAPEIMSKAGGCNSDEVCCHLSPEVVGALVPHLATCIPEKQGQDGLHRMASTADTA